MKKLFLALGLVFSLSLASCGGVDAKVDKLADLTKEAKELAGKVADGDQDAAKKLEEVSEEIKTLSDELKDADLTDEQKKKIAGAALGF